MNIRRGDIVMVDWLFSDRTGSKRRPALVVQADVYNTALDDTILALITGSARRRIGAATQLDIDIATPDGMLSGLVINSVVQCENLVTVDRNFILGIRGRLSTSQMQKVNNCLKAALDIP
jgi:mRNA interferase MazF